MPNKNLDASGDSSPATESDDNATDTSSEEASNENELSPLDIVTAELNNDSEDDAGVEGSDQEEESDTEETEDDSESDEDNEETEDAEETENTEEEDDDDDDIPTEFHEHPAWKRRIAKEKEANERAVKAEEQLESVQSKVDIFDNMGEKTMEFLSEFVALAGTDPEAAIKHMTPTLQTLLQKSGRTLSPELNQQVEDGEMTKEQAIEMSQLQAKISQLEDSGKNTKADTKADAAQAQVRESMEVTEKWEANKRSQDPDFKLLEEPMLERMSFILKRDGYPAAKDVNAFMDDIYKTVKGRYKNLSPKKTKTVKRVNGDTKKPNGSETRQYKGENTYDDVYATIKSIL